MNATHLIAAVAMLASAGSVLAQEYGTPNAGFALAFPHHDGRFRQV